MTLNYQEMFTMRHKKYVSLAKNSVFGHVGTYVPTILFLYGIFSVFHFQHPIGIVALSHNHMLRNLGRALLSVFSSVSVEIALWRRVFLGLDGFSCRKSCFSKNLCYGTLYCLWMSINVNVLLELVGLVSFTDRVRCSDWNLAISMSYYAFSTPKSANPDWMENWCISIVQSLGYLCMQWCHQWTWTSLPWTCIWNLQYCINKTLFHYKSYKILLINQRANICRHWCVYMKRPCVFNDALTFIDDLSVLGNLEGDRSEEVVLCSRHFWERVVHPRDHTMAAALFSHFSQHLFTNFSVYHCIAPEN
jgi:hypothetical protein